MTGQAERVPASEMISPTCQARDIVNWLETGQDKSTRPIPRYFDTDWCPDSWKAGRPPSKQSDPTYPQYEAVRDLARLSKERIRIPRSPVSKMHGTPFLKDWFDLMGKPRSGTIQRGETLHTQRQ